MKTLVIMTLLLSGAAATYAQTPAASSSATKSELIQKVLTLQQPAIEGMAHNLVEQPATQMMQAASRAMQQVPENQRESVGRAIESDIKKYVDESSPFARERAVKVAPNTVGGVLNEKFTEDELKQLVAWLESPVNKKYLQLSSEMQTGFMQKLISEVRPTLDPKLQALELRVRSLLGVPAAASASAPGSSPTAPQVAPKPVAK